MSSLDRLAGDQRAVVELVLKQGRGYDEIATLLSIDRAGVRERALSAFDALGPHTRVPPERRALITDYLLGQLPPRVADDTREHLSQSASERAWARSLASELGPISAKPLPEIPDDAEVSEPAAAATAERTSAGARRGGCRAGRWLATAMRPAPDRTAGRPASRRGGIALLSLGALVVAGVVVAVILIATHKSSHDNTTPAASQPAATSTATTSTTPTSTTTTPSSSTTATNGAHLVAQINLTSPSKGSKAVGVALVLKQGGKAGIAIRAQNLPANGKHDAYAVWLYKTAKDSHILGFVDPSDGSNGVLQEPRARSRQRQALRQLLVRRGDPQSPKGPGPIVLQGQAEGTLTGPAPQAPETLDRLLEPALGRRRMEQPPGSTSSRAASGARRSSLGCGRRRRARA